MTVAEKTKPSLELEALFADKEMLQDIVARQFDDLGWKYDPASTVEEAYQSLLAEGVCSEDNLLSRAIIAVREE